MSTENDLSDRPFNRPLQRYSVSGATMGTRYSAVFFATPGQDGVAVDLINSRLFAAVDQVDRQMSTWKPDSDLNRLNTAPLQQWVNVPHGLVDVLQAALDVGRQSGGAFDIGVGALVDAWGFGAQPARPVRTPAPAPQPACAAGDALELDCASLRVRKKKEIMLDLSGIAKGYGVDQMARCLDHLGITSYLVGIDGEMRARGVKPGGGRWAVALEKPLEGVREVGGVMELLDAAIATSGDYRRFVDIDGQRHAHTMHPQSGRPVRNRVAAVTVVGATCMLADAWATALLVLGEDAGVALAQQRGMDALFVLHSEGDDGDGTGFDELSIVGGQLQTQ